MEESTQARAPTTVEIGGRKAFVRDCPLCGTSHQDTSPTKYGFEVWKMVTCNQCGFAYVIEAPVYQELKEDHAWEASYTSWGEGRKKRYPIKSALSKPITGLRKKIMRTKQIGPLVAQMVKSGKVIDIGCGVGNQLRMLQEGYIPCGIEIAAETAKRSNDYAQTKGGEVVCAPATEGLQSLEANSFAGVMMIAYLEHEAAPKPVMEGVYRVLEAGGMCIIKVPNFACLNRKVMGNSWCGFRFPDHLNYFTPKTLKRICTDAGLEIARCNFVDSFAVSDNMWLFARKPRS